MWTAALGMLGQAASAPDTGSAISSATGAPISWNQAGEWNSATGSAKVSTSVPPWVLLAGGALVVFYLLKKG